MNRRFPRSLVVTVVPRVAVLVITDSKGQLELVDADGVAFRSVDKAPKGLAVVRKAASGELTKEGVAAALQVVTALPKALRERVKDVRLTESDSVTFRIGTVAVVWGDAEQPERKARLIEILLRERTHRRAGHPSRQDPLADQPRRPQRQRQHRTERGRRNQPGDATPVAAHAHRQNIG